MEQPEFIPPTEAQIETYQQWWSTLSPEWQTAYNETMLRRTTTEMPLAPVLHQIWQSPAHRFAGPRAPYPNMSFELSNMDGVLALKNVQILVITFHQLTHLKGIEQMPQLSSLFVFNNQIATLEGVEALTDLLEIYFNVNQVESLEPLRHLTKLHTLYCNYNRVSSLEPIGVQHKPALKNFVCLPNDLLPDEEVLRMEQEIRIRCLKG